VASCVCACATSVASALIFAFAIEICAVRVLSRACAVAIFECKVEIRSSTVRFWW
jgi:hypothetical protein